MIVLDVYIKYICLQQNSLLFDNNIIYVHNSIISIKNKNDFKEKSCKNSFKLW